MKKFLLLNIFFIHFYITSTENKIPSLQDLAYSAIVKKYSSLVETPKPYMKKGNSLHTIKKDCKDKRVPNFLIEEILQKVFPIQKINEKILEHKVPHCLYISHEVIPFLKELSNISRFRFNQLTFLTAEYCEIENLEPGIFKNQPHLKSLNLRGNNIKLLKDNTFQGLTSLTKLFLSYNEIESLKKDIFQGLDSLESLDLSNNKINLLKPKSLKNLPRLRSLSLYNNKLTHFNLEELNYLPDLISLNIRHNYLKKKKCRKLSKALKVTEGYGCYTQPQQHRDTTCNIL